MAEQAVLPSNGARPPRGRSAPAASAKRRSHAGRAKHTLIGNLARPPVQMHLERPPSSRPAAGNRIALDVADPAFVLPLRTRPVGRPSPRHKSPVAAKGVQPHVDPHLLRCRIVMFDQRLRVVEISRPERLCAPARKFL